MPVAVAVLPEAVAAVASTLLFSVVFAAVTAVVDWVAAATAVVEEGNCFA